MTVQQRNGHWHYSFSYQGQIYRQACGKGCKSKTRALQIEADARAKAMLGELPAKRRKMLTLTEAAKEFLAEKEAAQKAGNLAPNTLRHYRNAWDAWLSGTPLASMRVNQITKASIEAVQFPGGPFTTKNARQALGSILEWCRGERLISMVPKLKGARLEGRKVRITPEIEGALRQHMERDVADILTAMLDAMMRPAEIMAMRWEHVDWAAETYFIPEGKTDAARRTVPISKRMIAMLRSRQVGAKQVGAKTEWIFPSRIHAKGHRVTIAKQFRAAREAAGIDSKVKLYCARHTGASELSEMGVDLLTLRELLGHEDISTTNKYLHGDAGKAKEAINRRNVDRTGLEIVRRKA